MSERDEGERPAAGSEHAARVAAEMRANLKKRKARQRSRTAGRPGPLDADEGTEER